MKLKVLGVKKVEGAKGFVSLNDFKSDIFDSGNTLDVVELGEGHKGFRFHRIHGDGIGQMSPTVVRRTNSIIDGEDSEVYIETEGFIMRFEEVL